MRLTSFSGNHFTTTLADCSGSTFTIRHPSTMVKRIMVIVTSHTLRNASGCVLPILLQAEGMDMIILELQISPGASTQATYVQASSVLEIQFPLFQGFEEHACAHHADHTLGTRPEQRNRWSGFWVGSLLVLLGNETKRNVGTINILRSVVTKNTTQA